MGFIFSEDGECIVCGQHTNKFCDACRRYICDEHQVQKPVEDSTKVLIFCRECYEKGKSPRNADMKGLHPHYHFDR
jgi:hypothetical protein